MTYDAIVEAVNQQLAREADMSDDERIWIFKEVKDHRKKDNTWEVLMKWEDDSETWEPLNAIWKSDPVTLAQYAKENDLLQIPGWKRLRYYVKNEKKMKRMMKQVRINSMRNGPRIKFGVRVPKDYDEAKAFDRLNENNLWDEATSKEMGQVYEYESFKSLERNAQILSLIHI